jgi:hypothetical protein
MKRKKRQLGMDRGITPRDFLNGSRVEVIDMLDGQV